MERKVKGAEDRPAGAAEPQLSAEPAEVVSLEKGLLTRARAGDEEAIRALLMRHSNALYTRIILPRVGDPSSAEDILRSTMVTAIDKLHTFQLRDRSIYFWLRQIAVNKVIDHHRANVRSRKLAKSLAAEPDYPLASSMGPGPETALIAEEERRINRERIERALAQLNPRYRQVIELRLLEELPREECARRLEVTLGTLDVLFYRAVRAMRRALGES